MSNFAYAAMTWFRPRDQSVNVITPNMLAHSFPLQVKQLQRSSVGIMIGAAKSLLNSIEICEAATVTDVYTVLDSELKRPVIGLVVVDQVILMVAKKYSSRISREVFCAQWQGSFFAIRYA